LAEKAALITGGSSGIGLAIARALGADGYALTISARRPEKLEQAAEVLRGEGLEVLSVPANMTSEEDVVSVVSAHRERYGRMDVLVNNAGVGIGQPMAEITTKYLDMQLGVNLRAVVIATRESLPLLREARGHVINLASIAGTIPTPGLAGYGASKAALISLTHSLNREEAGSGVRATALCPAFVDTRMTEWTGIGGEEMIQPEDCAELVRTLLRLSPKARVPVIVVERIGDVV
jgi:NAD(P)-dependent dehydrogenase (short-subunit alcohol dehydrogenase family)